MPLWCEGCARWVPNSQTDSSAAHYDCPGRRPTDAAIAEAQAANERGEVNLLEATFLADVLSDHEGAA